MVKDRRAGEIKYEWFILNRIVSIKYQCIMQIFNGTMIKGALWLALTVLVLGTGTLQVSAQQGRRHIREGNRLYHKELFDESELSYRRALESDENSPQARFNLGNSLYKQERFEEAARHFGELADEVDEPRNRSKVYHNLGNSMLMMEQVEQSIEAYKEALRNNPLDDETRYNLAFAQNLIDQMNDRQPEGGDDQQEGEEGDEGHDMQGDDEGDDRDQERDDEGTGDEGEDREQQQQPRPDQISPEDALRMLEAAEREEQRVQEKLMEQKEQQQTRTGRNW